MILGRVVGTVVATQKHEKYEGSKLLLVQPLDLGGADSGDEMIAVDGVGAGAGETVLVVQEGRSTSLAMGRDLSPANAAIIGIVDQIDRHDDT
jgi:ethanolamine utilization protein EutN